MIFAFGDFELDLPRVELRENGDPVPIEPQVFRVLAYLLTHRERVVTKEELIGEVWGHRFVSESALTSRIKAIRAALGDDGRRQAVIRTVHGHGYQFVATAITLTGAGDVERAGRRPSIDQEIRFCTTPDGFVLAAAESGAGPPLLKAANWLTHVELDAHSPVWHHWLRDLGRSHRLIRYDERGCGLSDRDLRDSSLSDLDVWVGDLETVTECFGLERFALLGVSQGGVVAVAYAVRHPEHVSHLILYGAYTRGMRRRGTLEQQARAALQLDLMRVGWAQPNPAFRQVFTRLFMPDAGEEEADWFTDLQRVTTTAENAVRFEAAFYDLDISDLARAVTVPTLVLHATEDAATPFDEGRRLASLIPGARFVPLASRNHIITVGEPAWHEFLEAVGRFTAS